MGIIPMCHIPVITPTGVQDDAAYGDNYGLYFRPTRTIVVALAKGEHMSQRQQGFKVLVLVAIIVGIALLSLLVWSVYSATQQPHTPQTPGQPAKQDTPKEPPANTGNYVAIKEWGIRFTPQAGLSGVVYTIGSQQLPEDNITFSTTALSEYGEACAGKVNGRTPLGVLTRTTAPKEERNSSSGAFVKKIGNYYYEYRTPQSACSDTSAEANALQTRTLNGYFKPSIITLEQMKQ